MALAGAGRSKASRAARPAVAPRRRYPPAASSLSAGRPGPAAGTGVGGGRAAGRAPRGAGRRRPRPFLRGDWVKTARAGPAAPWGGGRAGAGRGRCSCRGESREGGCFITCEPPACSVGLISEVVEQVSSNRGILSWCEELSVLLFFPHFLLITF